MRRSIFLAALFCSCASGSPATAQTVTIFHNGHIYTQDPGHPWAQSIATQGGKITAVGSDPEVKSKSGKDAKMIDLEGRTVIPGLVDGHVHLSYAANDLANYNCSFSQYSTFDEVIAAVAACAKRLKPGEWLVGTSWNSKLYDKLNDASSLAALDAVTPDNPTILRNDTIHDRWVNSLALKAAGITVQTPDPTGGAIGKDRRTKSLNGLLIEGPARQLVEKVSPLGRQVSQQETIERLRLGGQALNSFGVTAWVDARVSPTDVEAYKSLDSAGKLHGHVGLSVLVDPMTATDIPDRFVKLSQPPVGHVDTRFAKIFLDGVMVSRTAVFNEPYLHAHGEIQPFYGTPKVTQDRLNSAVTQLDKLGVSVKMHAAGDGAVTESLNAIAAARSANGNAGPIHTVAHGGYVTTADMDRYVRLRAAPDASPTVWYPGPILDGTIAAIGPERARNYWAIKTMLEKRVMIVGGTDWKTLPDEFSDLWSGIEGMVTRRNPTGKVLGTLMPEQAIPLGTALDIYTKSGAAAMHLDKDIGVLEPGRSADFAVLNQNIFAINPSCLSNTRSVMTVFEGSIVFEVTDAATPPCSEKE